jgi:pimeloyl-ACP methyl ester carboxylesterase
VNSLLTTGIGSTDAYGTSEEIVARVEALSRRHETPCGEGNMIWRSWGAGPLLLLLHGAHGSWTHWIRNITALARTRTVLVPDIPGFGDSAMPQASDGDTVARILAQGASQFSGGDPIPDVIGFSTGGVFGATVAAVAPDLVGRLVLVDCGGLNTAMGEFSMRSVRNLDSSTATEAHRHNLLQMMLHSPSSVDALALHIQMQNVARARLDARPIVLPDGLLRALYRSLVPVDAIWAQFDRPHPDPEHQHQALQQVRPHSRLRVVRNAGHWCPFENPAGFHEALALLGLR